MKNFINDILYIGSAKNLFKRYKSHDTLKRLSKFYDDIFFYFKEVDNYLEIEKQLIKKHQPRHNITWL
ncbi:MAG TPA: GIY-YIG nuclease family protein [Exilispira sp.]|nr:GIY-YIG nuclease family protein [Exilispira sp.]